MFSLKNVRLVFKSSVNETPETIRSVNSAVREWIEKVASANNAELDIHSDGRAFHDSDGLRVFFQLDEKTSTIVATHKWLWRGGEILNRCILVNVNSELTTLFSRDTLRRLLNEAPELASKNWVKVRKAINEFQCRPEGFRLKQIGRRRYEIHENRHFNIRANVRVLEKNSVLIEEIEILSSP